MHEKNFKAVNQVIASLNPSPQLICFTGDNIMGNVSDYDELRRQWKYFLETEMAWLDRHRTPFYSTTSNHNTYDAGSEQVWREVFSDLPQNGPENQKGLSYYVRKDNLLLVCVNTNFSGFADPPERQVGQLGHGHVECRWLERILAENSDATYKFVAGHVPAHPLNGYSRYPVWRMFPDEATTFWEVLVKHGVIAYLCSHVIAFDAQVHSGVLQITTGGAGTNHGPRGFMPGRTEYLHAVQMAVDKRGLRYQVLDAAGKAREWLEWPVKVPRLHQWQKVPADSVASVLKAASAFLNQEDNRKCLTGFRFSGVTSERDPGSQTLLCGWDDQEPSTTIWVGLEGRSNQLKVRILPESGGSAEIWTGPSFAPSQAFHFELLLHGAMGPGGVLFRRGQSDAWSSLLSSSSRGVERMLWPPSWAVGNAESGRKDRPFLGHELRLEWFEDQLEQPRPQAQDRRAETGTRGAA